MVKMRMIIRFPQYKVSYIIIDGKDLFHRYGEATKEKGDLIVGLGVSVADWLESLTSNLLLLTAVS